MEIFEISELARSDLSSLKLSAVEGNNCEDLWIKILTETHFISQIFSKFELVMKENVWLDVKNTLETRAITLPKNIRTTEN